MAQLCDLARGLGGGAVKESNPGGRGRGKGKAKEKFEPANHAAARPQEQDELPVLKPLLLRRDDPVKSKRMRKAECEFESTRSPATFAASVSVCSPSPQRPCTPVIVRLRFRLTCWAWARMSARMVSHAELPASTERRTRQATSSIRRVRCRLPPNSIRLHIIIRSPLFPIPATLTAVTTPHVLCFQLAHSSACRLNRIVLLRTRLLSARLWLLFV